MNCSFRIEPAHPPIMDEHRASRTSAIECHASYDRAMPRSPAQEQKQLVSATDGAPAEGEVWTIGHSTHSIPAFLELLHAHGIETVADVRRFPGSRRHPQFGADALSASLQAGGIDYHWFPELGGRRKPDLLEPEGSAWRHPSFRAYAQYLRTEEFAQGLDSLLHASKGRRTAIMCSELLWWRCHRRLIADVMLLCGWEVTHILGIGESSAHRLGPPAQVTPGGLSYAAHDADGAPHCC
jgi:hypothetical protein